MIAFGGETDRRAQALADAQAAVRGDSAAQARVPGGDDIELLVGKISQSYGFAPSFAYLFVALGKGFAAGIDPVFRAVLLEAIAAGTATATLVNQWVIWIVEQADASPVRLLDGTAFTEPVGRLVALHKAVIAGQAVDEAAWRKCRRMIARADHADPVIRAAADLMAATGWNFAKLPAASADLPNAWFALAQAQADVTVSWKPAMNAEVEPFFLGIQQAVAKKMGPRPKDGDDFDSSARSRFAERLAYLRDPATLERSAILDLMDARGAAAGKLQTEALDRMRAGLVMTCACAEPRPCRQ